MAEQPDDGLEIPDFLKVRNRKALTPEQAARIAEVYAKAPQPAPIGKLRRPEDQAIADQLREEQRQRDIQGMKNRLARSKERKEQGKPPAGSVWDTRFSRWVMPGEKLTIQGLAEQAGPTTKQIMQNLKKEREMTERPKFEDMTGAQLRDFYNETVDATVPKRKAKFENKEMGVRLCEKAWVDAAKRKAASPKAEAATKAARAAAAEKPKADPAAKPAKVPLPVVPGAREKKLDMKIKLVAPQKPNPRREGTEAHRHFEAMRGNPTVREYLEKFKPEERRTASQWLSNTVRDSHAKVEA